MIRAFIALPVPDASVDALLAAQDGFPIGRPVDEDNLHLTLAYLGNRSEADLRRLHDALAEIASDPVTLTFAERALMGGRQPNLACVTVRPTPELTALRDAVHRAVRGAGLDLPRERFRPHVTLIRFPRAQAARHADRIAEVLAHPAPVPGGAVSEMSLMRSTLTPEGSINHPLAVYPLTNHPGALP